MKTFFCSDLHLGHKNILKYEPMRIKAVYERFYKDSEFTEETFKNYVLELYESGSPNLIDIVKQHDDLLIENWNNVVNKNDEVWFLGDFCFNSYTTAPEYIKRLHGQIHLIKGNHDKKTDEYYRDAGFVSVSKYPIILKHHFILSHAPFEEMNENKNFFYLYGHIHSNEYYETKTENSSCACVERHNLAPYRLDEFDKYVYTLKRYSSGGSLN